MFRKLFFIGVNYIVVAVLVRGEIYSSVLGLQQLVTTQKLVTERLQVYMDTELEKLALVREYLNKLKREQMETIINAGKPQYRLKFLKRLTIDLEYIKDVASNKTEFEPPVNVTDGNLVRNVTYPSQHDLIEAANSVGRLQETYLLDVHEMAAGRIRGSISTSMTANDCYELGRILYEEGNFETSTGWLLEAYHMVDPAVARQRPMLVAKTIEALCYAYIGLDDLENVNKWEQTLEELRLDDTDIIDIISRVKGVLSTWKSDHNDIKKPILDTNSIAYNLTRDYKRLCRGEMEQPPEIKNRLKCQYLMDNPFLMLAPLKMEELYINPDVFLFYDVISDPEIEQIKTAGSSKLYRSMVVLRNESRGVVKNRISMISWLNLDDETKQKRNDALAKKIDSRIEDISGLSALTSESIQLAVYPPGGMYMPHYDTLKNRFLNEEHRIATVMFYLSDVEAGGATVFIKLGVTVNPIKGAALFWYNVHSGGDRHMNTLHAACPVLLGQKWAANIWIRYIGQEFLYPCEIGGDLIDETISPPVSKPSSEAGS